MPGTISTPTSRPRGPRWSPLRWLAPASGATLSLLFALASAAAAELELPGLNPEAPIRLSAAAGSTWKRGEAVVWHLWEDVTLAQGDFQAQAGEAIVWVYPPDRPGESRLALVYLEGAVRLRQATTGDRAARVEDEHWLKSLYTYAEVDVRPRAIQRTGRIEPAVYRRAQLARNHVADGSARQVQFLEELPPGTAVPVEAPSVPANRPRRIIARPRYQGQGVQARTFPSPNGRDQVVVLDSGVNVLVEGVSELGLLDLSADRVVVWTSNLDADALTGGGQAVDDLPVEIYLEGDIVFRQGDRVIYADRMYYNLAANRGVVLDAELLTPLEGYAGLVRLKSDVLSQINEQQFLAHQAAITTSRLGVPRYWLQSEAITFRDRRRPLTDPATGAQLVDPVSGEPAVDHDLLATSRNNAVYLFDAPIFYWPTVATDLTEPTFYVQNVRFGSDSIFGIQVGVDFNAYQVLGIEPIEGVDWKFSTDLLTERGFGLGTTVEYERAVGFLGFPAPNSGIVDVWGLYDEGRDDLGRDRLGLAPPDEFRGRIFARHKQLFPYNVRLESELGALSDKNFLEQFYENEWDTFKDQDSNTELSQIIENKKWRLLGQSRLNDFFTQTEWLPRADLFHFGEPLLDNRLFWHGHTHIGYARLATAEPSADPADPSLPLAWEQDSGGVRYVDREGVRAGTRQEFDLPLDAGPVKVIPYALGDVTYYHDDVDGNDLTRVYGQGGVRTSLPLWSVDRSIKSRLLNLNGIAHKVTLESDVFYGDSSEPLGQLPLYDPLDDDAQEAFRRRFLIPGGVFFGEPSSFLARFDERTYALRSGMAEYVAAPSMEIADDLFIAQWKVRNRWQTKRGLPGQQRIVDYITWDVGGSIFPNADRDNFDQEFGMVNYDFRWHVGDRVTLLSDGYFDFFGDGLRTATLGTLITRPEQGEFYLGVRSIEGPISSNVLTAAFAYRLSEKWIASASTAVDFGETGNIGQSMRIIRIGEAFLVSVGLNVDSGRDNVGVNFAIEPRFLPNTQLSRLGGVSIPPAGARGLE